MGTRFILNILLTFADMNAKRHPSLIKRRIFRDVRYSGFLEEWLILERNCTTLEIRIQIIHSCFLKIFFDKGFFEILFETFLREKYIFFLHKNCTLIQFNFNYSENYQMKRAGKRLELPEKSSQLIQNYTT